ncbi:hypothetical protein V6N13_068666 [Hibiscus sabdariffa]
MEQRILPLVTVSIGPPNSQSTESSLETNSALDASKSTESIPASRIHSRKLESDENGSDVSRSDIDMPLVDLWTYPCIAFAIQTLTGIPCDTKKISESNNGKAPMIQATPEISKIAAL